MTRDELIRAVTSVMLAQGTEEEQDETISALLEELPGAMISDLIFYSKVAMTAEEIVDEALRRVETHSIRLGYSPPPDGN